MKKIRKLLIVSAIFIGLQILSILGSYLEVNPNDMIEAISQGIGYSAFAIIALILVIIVYRKINTIDMHDINLSKNENVNDTTEENLTIFLHKESTMQDVDNHNSNLSLGYGMLIIGVILAVFFFLFSETFTGKIVSMVFLAIAIIGACVIMVYNSKKP